MKAKINDIVIDEMFLVLFRDQHYLLGEIFLYSFKFYRELIFSVKKSEQGRQRQILNRYRQQKNNNCTKYRGNFLIGI